MSVVNEIDVKALQETIDAVRATPKLGQVTFAVDGTWQGGFRIKAQTGALTQGGERDEQRVVKCVLAAQRKERARIRSEKGIRWGGRPLTNVA
ncbi:hypothetical protein [Streptomyces bobili]|uniref:hypothetical protein n=1 Tax=Streptomyces bobili TaxID=67280 RepID=UPI003F4DA154